MNTFRAASLAACVALVAGFAVGRWTGTADAPPSDGLQSQLATLQSQLKEIQSQIERNGPSSDATSNKTAVAATTSHSLQMDKLQQTFETESRTLRDEVETLQRLLAEAEQNRYTQLLRAGVHLHEAGYDEDAIVEFTKAIGYDPSQANAYLDRGLAFQNLGRWEQARADFVRASELAPDNFMAWNNLAWLLATCPMAEIRDGAVAVASANKACELTEWKYFAPLSSLATAHAEAGDFKQAIEWQQKAIAAAPDAVRAALEENLELFQQQQPVRQAETELGAEAKRP